MIIYYTLFCKCHFGHYDKIDNIGMQRVDCRSLPVKTKYKAEHSQEGVEKEW